MIVEERMATYLETLDREAPKYVRDIEEGALEDKVPIIKRQTQSMLRFLLRTHKPLKVLEIGTAVGFSSIFMSEYLTEGATITTIEKVPKRIELAKQNFKKTEKEAVITLLEGDADDILSELEAKKETYPFIFLDAAKGQYLNFLPRLLSLLSAGGLLVSDNVLQEGDILESRYAVTRRDRTIHTRMREYLDAISKSEALETVVLPIGDGIAISTKR